MKHLTFSVTLSLCCPGVNFFNILRAAFVRADPESVKKTVKLSVLFTLSGYACAKAACRMLKKLTIEQCFSTGGLRPSSGPWSSFGAPPGFFHLVKNYNFIHKFNFLNMIIQPYQLQKHQ